MGNPIIGVNRKGLERSIPVDIEQQLLGVDAVFDGELIGDVYHVFDLLEAGGLDLSKEPYEARHRQLRKLLGTLHGDQIKLVPLMVIREEKRALVAELSAGRKEGVVFKRLDSVYTPGKVDNLKKSVAVKIKFYTEGSFFVLDWNKDTSSVQVAALDGKKHVLIGNVTVPAKYEAQVVKGSVVRVRYLYATPAPANKLYQPNLDPTDDGIVVADGSADKLGSLKYEGKDSD